MEQLEKLVGTVLDGRYQLGSVLGFGASAVVFRADDFLLSRTVAIKMLRSEPMPAAHPTGETQKEYHERTIEAKRINRHAFLQESRAAALLSHPHIVTVFDVCPEGENPYIVMELVEGMSLAERIRERGVLPLHELLYIGRCVLEALQHAHENGIIHRDIKEQNILLTKGGGVKVTDFGIAEIGGRHTWQLNGKVLGTVETMSPEQAAGLTVDARSDLYSVGVLLYRMATGHFPFEADDPHTIAFLHQTEPPRYPTTFNPAIPRGLEQIILAALEKEPRKRFSSAAAMLAAVRRLSQNTRVVFRHFPQRDALFPRALHRSAWFSSACGFALAVVMFFSALSLNGLFTTPQVAVVEVPPLVGLAEEEMPDFDSRIEVVRQYAFYATIREGTVVAQSPAAGTLWKLEGEAEKTLYLTIATHDQSRITQ